MALDMGSGVEFMFKLKYCKCMMHGIKIFGHFSDLFPNDMLLKKKKSHAEIKPANAFICICFFSCLTDIYL